MKSLIFIVLLQLGFLFGNGQNNSEPDILWGNSSYYNLNVGDSIILNSTVIKLLELNNHFNKIEVGNDTIWLKVSRRSLPVSINNVRLFVADNRNVKNITDDTDVHGLLLKDVLICVSDSKFKMLDPHQYRFPISFNDGFLWSVEEDSYMFSYWGKEEKEREKYFRSYEGIGLDLNDARGIEKHWIVAMENSTVVWVEDKNIDRMEKEACVLLQSDSNPAIYYLYNHLYTKTIEVKKGQKLMSGELLGTVWGDEDWSHLQLLVIKSDSVPTYQNRFHNSLNFFPQLYELYFQHAFSTTKSFTRGRIQFGRSNNINQNQKNTSAYEIYAGKGWDLQRWNTADKVERAEKGNDGNARLKKVLFSGSAAKCVNPNNYYDYILNVKNGVYRIRAKVGDLYLPSWQKVEFEGVSAETYSLEAGVQKWTSERVVKVADTRLTVRIYIDEENKKVAGLSEIVFQQAY
ncbi:hypothetical protein OU798_22570 [Prolixibacteraceae bacterium Z1-6]|uniref:Uncharacterized protein n=1 Tax=Draconibacterium aestuarii TaxID=2998507 RepID=A0A9X3J9V4_9BACT|nr:hypothetical protein [Prolixibacteraceae bacterium Z1-6]